MRRPCSGPGDREARSPVKKRPGPGRLRPRSANQRRGPGVSDIACAGPTGPASPRTLPAVRSRPSEDAPPPRGRRAAIDAVPRPPGSRYVPGRRRRHGGKTRRARPVPARLAGSTSATARGLPGSEPGQQSLDQRGSTPCPRPPLPGSEGRAVTPLAGSVAPSAAPGRDLEDPAVVCPGRERMRGVCRGGASPGAEPGGRSRRPRGSVAGARPRPGRRRRLVRGGGRGARRSGWRAAGGGPWPCCCA